MLPQLSLGFLVSSGRRHALWVVASRSLSIIPRASEATCAIPIHWTRIHHHCKELFEERGSAPVQISKANKHTHQLRDSSESSNCFPRGKCVYWKRLKKENMGFRIILIRAWIPPCTSCDFV